MNKIFILTMLFCLCTFSVKAQTKIIRAPKKQQTTTSRSKTKAKSKPNESERPTIGEPHPKSSALRPISHSESSNNIPKSNNSVAKSTQGILNGYEWVDLGLSVKWATCNVGASSTSDYGGYYAWGETRTKSRYDWDNCFDCLDSRGDNWGTYKLGGQTRIPSTNGHDTARENWGSTWRMPTDAEFDELCEKCKWKEASNNGQKGYIVTGPNGNSIFLPYAGNCDGIVLSGVGEYGTYWTSTLSSYYSSSAGFLLIDNANHLVIDDNRKFG